MPLKADLTYRKLSCLVLKVFPRDRICSPRFRERRVAVCTLRDFLKPSPVHFTSSIATDIYDSHKNYNNVSNVSADLFRL